MTSTEILQRRLQQLPADRREAVAARLLEEMEAIEWDSQIDADAEAGKLDDLVRRARNDHREGRTKPF